jgi:hypothetical protein
MATLWGTPASRLLNRIVTAAPAGTEMRELLNANPLAVRSIVTGTGTVLVGAVVAGVPVLVTVGGAVVPVVVTCIVVGVGVIIVGGTIRVVAVGVTVGVTGPVDVHPAMRAKTAITANIKRITVGWFMSRFIVRKKY